MFLYINSVSEMGYKAQGLEKAMLGSWKEAARDLRASSRLDFDAQVALAPKKVNYPLYLSDVVFYFLKYERLRKEKKLRRIELERKMRRVSPKLFGYLVLQLIVYHPKSSHLFS